MAEASKRIGAVRYLPGVASKLAHRRNVGNFFGIGVESKALGDFPDEYLAIFGGRGDEAVVERVPTMDETAVSVAMRRQVIREPFWARSEKISKRRANTNQCRERQLCGHGREGSGRGACHVR